MRWGKWLAVVLAVGSISTGVAIAGGGWSKTERVEGDFTATVVKEKSRKCDRKHVRFELRFRGEQSSTDRRLAGDLKIDATSVINTENGWGRTKGEVEIRPSETYAFGSFRGEFVGVVGPGGNIEGFITGSTRGHSRSVYLLANFNAVQDGDSLTGEFGKDSQAPKPYGMPGDEDPAVITNACFKKHGHGHRKGRH